MGEFAKHGKTVIVLIDECDRIGLDFKSESREAEKDALTQLWKVVDEMKGDPRVFFVFATNKKEKDFDSRFISRITRKVHMGNPSHSERLESLERQFKKQRLQASAEFLNDLAQKTEEFTFRHLKNLTRSIKDELAANNSVNKPTIFKLIDQIKKDKEELEKREKEKDEEEPRRRQIMEEQHVMQKESLEQQKFSSKVSYGFQTAQLVVSVAGVAINIIKASILPT